MANSIVWDNNATNSQNLYKDAASFLAVDHTIIKGGAGDLADADPLFVDPQRIDYRLRVGSPLINAGNPTMGSWPYDLAGSPRLQGAAPDVGAYEGGFDVVDLGGQVTYSGIVDSGPFRVWLNDENGTRLWEIHGMSGLTIPTPFAKHGLLYLSSGYPGGGLRPVYVVKPGASGDISIWTQEEMRTGLSSGFPGQKVSSDDVAWAYPLLGTYNTSALVYGDYYYTLLDRGFLVAHDARTGEDVYRRQRLEIGNGFTASPWAYNGKVFLLSEDLSLIHISEPTRPRLIS